MCNVCVKSKEKTVINLSKTTSFYDQKLSMLGRIVFIHKELLQKNTVSTQLNFHFLYQLITCFTHNPQQLPSLLILNK